MFSVEKDARDCAKQIAEEAKQKGLSEKQVARVDRKDEAREVQRNNAWIKKNVGLD